jgi:hypothetical protein
VDGDLITGKVSKVRPTHVGVTYSPAWGKEGTWVNEFGTEKDMLRTLLRNKYGKRPGVKFPPNMSRLLAESEHADAQRISARRADRERKQEKEHSLFGAASVMASDPAAAAPAITPPPPVAQAPPPVDKMEVTAPSKLPSPVATQPPQPTQTTAELLGRWKEAREGASKAGTLHERVEVLKRIRADFGRAMKAGAIDPDEYYNAGGQQFEREVRFASLLCP